MREQVFLQTIVLFTLVLYCATPKSQKEIPNKPRVTEVPDTSSKPMRLSDNPVEITKDILDSSTPGEIVEFLENAEKYSYFRKRLDPDGYYTFSEYWATVKNTRKQEIIDLLVERSKMLLTRNDNLQGLLYMVTQLYHLKARKAAPLAIQIIHKYLSKSMQRGIEFRLITEAFNILWVTEAKEFSRDIEKLVLHKDRAIAFNSARLCAEWNVVSCLNNIHKRFDKESPQDVRIKKAIHQLEQYKEERN